VGIGRRRPSRTLPLVQRNQTTRSKKISTPDHQRRQARTQNKRKRRACPNRRNRTIHSRTRQRSYQITPNQPARRTNQHPHHRPKHRLPNRKRKHNLTLAQELQDRTSPPIRPQTTQGLHQTKRHRHPRNKETWHRHHPRSPKKRASAQGKEQGHPDRYSHRRCT
jgi:hypothetical protein